MTAVWLRSVVCRISKPAWLENTLGGFIVDAGKKEESG
jgi:hypothetical protein